MSKDDDTDVSEMPDDVLLSVDDDNYDIDDSILEVEETSRMSVKSDGD